jgi:1-acyl-sn-glycerol-3-phosphate acyltransferase
LLSGLLKLRVEGREHIRRNHPQIIACNHLSHVDPILVGYSSGLETWFLAKEEIFRASAAFGWLIRSLHAIPVNRRAADLVALRRCSEVLQRGNSLVLFPEGTRSKEGGLQPLRPGVAMLAIMNHVPVVPTFIHGVRSSFLPWLVDPDIIRYLRMQGAEGTLPAFASKTGGVPRAEMRWRLNSLWSSRVRVVFGPPILPNGLRRIREDYRRMTEWVAEALANLGAAHD